MIKMSYTKILCVLLLLKPAFSKEDCTIQPSTKNSKYKLYLNIFKWSVPTNNFNGKKDSTADGEVVQLTCNNGFVNDFLPGNSYNFQCTNGKFNETFLFEDLLCKSEFHKDTKTFQIPSIQFGSKLFKCEGKDLESYQVKAVKPEGHIKHLYTVCFDKNIMRTKFVFQPRRKEKLTYVRQPRRDVWGFARFGKNTAEKTKLSDGYVSRIQKKRITNAFPNKYSKNNKYPYSFNRGHLAPYADFIDTEDKKASCEYINVAPQWKELNGNSWAVIERETRDLVKENPNEWEIYTGTYGNIPTTRGPLFLSPFFNEKGKFIKGYVPVPKLYWKLVYNVENKNNSRAYLGINNPELKSPEEFTEKYVICKPLARSNTTLFRGSEFKGFTYECNVDEFLNKIGNLENILK